MTNPVECSRGSGGEIQVAYILAGGNETQKDRNNARTRDDDDGGGDDDDDDDDYDWVWAPRCGDSDQDSHAWARGWYLAAAELPFLKKAYSSQAHS